MSRSRPPSKHDDDRTQEIRASINQARHQISQSLDEIQDTVQDSLDWRGWVADNPWQAVGVGLAVGFYMGLR